MDGNQTVYGDMVRLSEVNGMFLDDAGNEKLIQSILTKKARLENDTARTSTFLNTNKVEYEKKLGKLKVIDKEIVENEKRMEQLLRQKKSIQDETAEYHATHVASWERQAANDLANIHKLEDDISVSAPLLSLFTYLPISHPCFSSNAAGSWFGYEQAPSIWWDAPSSPNHLWVQPS